MSQFSAFNVKPIVALAVVICALFSNQCLANDIYNQAHYSSNDSFSKNYLAKSSSQKSNRYKNTIPTSYQLTLKGYSIMEYSNNKMTSWSFDRVENRAFRKSTIMLSFNMRF